MSEMSKTPLQAIRPEAAIAAVQNGAACWSHAVSRLSEGFLVAAKAEAALASQVFKPDPNGSFKPLTPNNASEVMREWLTNSKARQDILLQGLRQINDDLMACYFAAAEDLAEGFNFKNSNAEKPGQKSGHNRQAERL